MDFVIQTDIYVADLLVSSLHAIPTDVNCGFGISLSSHYRRSPLILSNFKICLLLINIFCKNSLRMLIFRILRANHLLRRWLSLSLAQVLAWWEILLLKFVLMGLEKDLLDAHFVHFIVDNLRLNQSQFPF